MSPGNPAYSNSLIRSGYCPWISPELLQSYRIFWLVPPAPRALAVLKRSLLLLGKVLESMIQGVSHPSLHFRAAYWLSSPHRFPHPFSMEKYICNLNSSKYGNLSITILQLHNYNQYLLNDGWLDPCDKNAIDHYELYG